MPQVLLLIAAGAGLYAGYKWLSKELQSAVAEAERMAEQASVRKEAAAEPKDLGTLELDVRTGVYRPASRRS
ncbi:MAG: hypothetical protein AB1749_06645 [Pseudomonadota bacterium]